MFDAKFIVEGIDVDLWTPPSSLSPVLFTDKALGRCVSVASRPATQPRLCALANTFVRRLVLEKSGLQVWLLPPTSTFYGPRAAMAFDRIFPGTRLRT